MGRATQEDHELALAIALSESEAVQAPDAGHSGEGRVDVHHDAELARRLQEAEVAEAAQHSAENADAGTGFLRSSRTDSWR